jgi:ribonuclease R
MTTRTPSTAESADGARRLLEFMNRADYRPLAQRELLHRMHVTPDRRPAVRRLIRSLLDNGKLVKLSRGRLAPASSEQLVRGVLRRHRDGHGFVIPEGDGEDLFIDAGNMGEALSGDSVVARVTRRGRGGRLHGFVLRITGRRERRVLGVFVVRGRGGSVHPFDPTLSDPVTIPASFRSGAQHHEVVEIEILRVPRPGRPAEGKILGILGGLDDPDTDVRIVARKHGLVSEVPAKVDAAGSKLPRRPSPADKARRRRFDNPAPVTIDGATARDFDDAIAVEPRVRGGFRLYVHIADVAHYVDVGGILDQEARHRGTSVYFPDRVFPMLPERLSNDLCSLRPGVDRLVQSVVLDLDAEGGPTRIRLADGVIRSAARLTYEQVAALLRGDEAHGVPAKVVPMLRTADRLRALLEQRRARRGSIDFDLPQPQILLDVEGAMEGIALHPRNRAHRMIEEFMLVANEAVAGYLEERGARCLFRVHDPPDAVKLAQLAETLRGFGYDLDPESDPGAPELQALLEKAESRPEYSVVSQLVLRSMMQARYSTRNVGHFGLGAEVYCHFTSPIRRYPDLVVHRLVRATRARRKNTVVADAVLEGLARTMSDLERNAESAERELLTRKKIAYIAGREGQRFDGVITGVTKFGLFVQLEENLVDGLLRSDRLGSERFEFIETRQELRGRESGSTFRLGDRLRVRVDRVDRVLQRVDFSLDAAKEPARPGRRRRPAARRAGSRSHKRGVASRVSDAG